MGGKGERHTVGLWELLVGQGKRGLCQNVSWHTDKAARKAVANLKLMFAATDLSSPLPTWRC